MPVAAYVASVSAVICAAACVLAVWSSWRASIAAKKLRSMTSLQSELLEIRDYMAKLDAWAKRINARESTRARRESERGESSTHASTVNGADKNELRRRAGLVAGKPARHGE